MAPSASRCGVCEPRICLAKERAALSQCRPRNEPVAPHDVVLDPWSELMRTSSLCRLLAVSLTVACVEGPREVVDAPPLWRLADTLWIGATDGAGPEVFGSIDALTVDDSGRMYVFDGQARELRVFGADGSFLFRHGRRGGGPGEYQHVIGMSTSADGAVWLVDGGNARYTTLRGGDTLSFRRGAGVYHLPWLGGHVGDQLYDVVVVPGEGSREAMVRVDATGTVVDTLAVPARGSGAPRRGSMEFPLPYAPQRIRAFDHRGAVWVGSSHEYVLYRIGTAGDTTLVVRRDIEPRPLTASEADSVRRHVQALRSEFGVAVPDAQVPSRAPLLADLAVADDGSVWVTRAESPTAYPGGTLLDVFAPDGRYVATLELRFPLTRTVVRDGKLYGVALDELEVPRVFRARIIAGE